MPILQQPCCHVNNFAELFFEHPPDNDTPVNGVRKVSIGELMAHMNLLLLRFHRSDELRYFTVFTPPRFDSENAVLIVVLVQPVGVQTVNLVRSTAELQRWEEGFHF